MTTEIPSTVITGTRVNSSVRTVQKPFAGCKIDDADFLDTITERTLCTKCSQSRKYFCYKCYVVMPPLEGKIPQVQLPVQVAIIKHHREIDGKSTATHGPILAPDNVSIYTYPDLPGDTSKSILVFPAKNAEEAETFFTKQKKANNEVFPYDRIIFIDSTWNQTKKIIGDPQLADLPKIKLSGIESLFWRYQRGNPTTYLATIEAVYHICVSYHRVFVSRDYDGEYDNLLFFFRYMFNKVRHIYGPEKMRSYQTRPHLQQ